MMTTQKIRLLITLMGLAALGLMGFQWHWITSALTLRNEQFDLKVSDALQDVVRKLEKQEIIYLIRQREQIEQQQRKLEALNKNRLAKSSQSPKHSLPSEYASNRDDKLTGSNPTDALTPRNRSMTDFQANLINEFLRQRNSELPHIERFLRIHAEQERIFDAWFNQMDHAFWPTDSTSNGSVLMTVRSSVQKARQNAENEPPTYLPNRAKTKEKLLKVASASQSDLLKDVFKDLLFSKRPVEQRVNRIMLDSLLRKSLQERGIGIAYEFAIQNNVHQNIIFSTASYRPDSTDSELFKASLFPNELNTMPSKLLVYFPERQAFILENMGFTLVSSALLLLVILGCFYVAVATILKQKKLSDVKNDFINNMTHEFKTPISTISLAVGMAREQVETQGEPLKIKRYLGIVQDEIQRLGGHVEKVLQMALLDRGEIKLRPTTLNIHDVIEKVLNNLSVQLEQRQGEVELSFEAEQEIIQADELHLTNILTNLIDNANKYSLDAPPQIMVSTESDAENVYIRVTDHGLGMNKEQQTKIFEPFYRVPTGNVHDVKGFGLGLSYVKKMIEAHGGRIDVKSKPSEGSTFTIQLPLQKETLN
ncbi:sensor histidine kinase KdpD [Runella sp. CRIBMP]|uniref:sensor histidine kinase n=1 Tax=Runella sp. CRIBMP TaxID=2683261 RepID=UPI001E4A4D41|nr:HAMP domain-containing sensor histidine kinase [Runella sp. CRIBMP]